YLAPQGSDGQRGAMASARTRPAAPQRAHRSTAAAPETTRAAAPETTRVASVAETNVPAPAAPAPAEAAKLPEGPPAAEACAATGARRGFAIGGRDRPCVGANDQPC